MKDRQMVESAIIIAIELAVARQRLLLCITYMGDRTWT